MKAFKKIVTFILVLAISITTFILPTSASSIVEWDGKSPLEAGKTYIVSKNIGIAEELLIPQGTRLSVRKDAKLTFYGDSKVTVKGILSVAIGGTIMNSGKIYVDRTGELGIYGNFLSSLNGTIVNTNLMTVFNCGIAKLSSENMFYKTSTLVVKGKMTLLRSSNTVSSGKIDVLKNGELHFQGSSAMSLSSKLTNNGYMTVGSSAVFKNSGSVTIEKKAGYTRFGEVSNTKSGKFVDKRDSFNYEKMTVSSLVDEPEVISRGIDVSYAQGDIDWEKVANSGVEFAFIRAARGDTGTKPISMDTYFLQNIAGAQANGIDVGVYFYTYAETVEDAEAEARFLVAMLDGYDLQYPVVLDIEEEMQSHIPTEKLTKIIEAFFKIVMDAGYFPMLTSYKSWLEKSLDMTILDKYAIWLAQVNDVVTYEGAYYIWQYSHTGRVNGINGDVDLDISYRDFPSILKKLNLR